ncbi:DUF2796 domain-containing protein [Hyphomicrobium sp.]|uniref:DUF2796 domain-containing protein n=1 Tax=Hyphomicrobium sp. TaxID=82 RepID=UPI002CE66F9A|nr:DUF2796 domain-containing protein [Hyphomicrobium sp.]HVZ03360.1 DUF2796 domain-containing protein [Hyphomicrobium sp.]
MLKTIAGLATAAAILVSPAYADKAEHRQLGPHVHGQGTLDIAIEGNKVEMELVAPGMDIVGFEHIPSTDAQKAAVEKAKAKLTDVLSVFKLPAAAKCKADAANVESRKETHKPGEKDPDEAEESLPGHEHSEFHATYTITCAAPESLTGLETVYFTNFAGAQLLNVNVTTSKGQTQAQMTRAKPTLDLTGVM